MFHKKSSRYFSRFGELFSYGLNSDNSAKRFKFIPFFIGTLKSFLDYINLALQKWFVGQTDRHN